MQRFWLVIAFTFAFCTAAAAGRSKLDVVLLVDTSASMLTSDPDNLRLEAIRGFMALLDDQDRLAVLAFGDQVRRISDFVAMEAAARLRLEARVIPEMTPSAAYTNLHAALEQGLEQLRGHRPDALPVVVLFTDGRMDMGDPDTDRRLTLELTDTLLPRYRDRGARVYGLAFSEDSDRGLLDVIALNTGGFSHSAHRAEDVWRAFGELFELIKKPDRLPVKNGRFLVDSSVKEFKLLSGVQDARPVSLRSPSGRSTVNPPSERGNPVLTVHDPESGEWIINNGSDNDAVVAASDMTLTTDLPGYVNAQSLPLTFKAWVASESSAGGYEVMPTNMEAELSGLQDAHSRLAIALQDQERSGVFSGRLPALAAGTYSLELTAVGKSYRRSKHLILTVEPGAAVPAKSGSVSTGPAAGEGEEKAAPSPLPSSSALIRIEDQAAWQSLQWLIGSNLLACAMIGLAYIWRRRRGKGK